MPDLWRFWCCWGHTMKKGGTDNKERGKYFRNHKTDHQWCNRGSAILLYACKASKRGQHRE